MKQHTHKSDNKVSTVKTLTGSYRKTHCKTCGMGMSRDKKTKIGGTGLTKSPDNPQPPDH
jgi:hypothetical protein